MKEATPVSIYTALRIPTDLRQQAEREAKRRGRTLSNYIKYLIQRDLARDYVGEEPPQYRARVLRIQRRPKSAHPTQSPAKPGQPRKNRARSKSATPQQ